MSRDDLAGALSAFAASTIVTLRETLGIDASFEAMPMPDPTHAGMPRVTVAIEITGDLRRVTWVFPVELARELTHRMVGEQRTDLDDAAAIELANILTGRGTASLEERGLQITLATPHIAAEVASGAGLRLVTPAGPIEIVFDLRRSRT